MRRTLLLCLLILTVAGPLWSTADGLGGDWRALDSAPGSAAALEGGHWLGTDELGRDLWVRLWLGLRGSLQIACLAMGVAVLLGVVLGTVMGGWSGLGGAVLARGVDILASLPLTLLALVCMSALGRGVAQVACVLGALGAVPVARAVRLGVVTAKGARHQCVARIHGADRWERLRWGWLPAVAGAARTGGIVLLPQLLVAEGTLGFIGLSVPDPAITLGSLLAEGAGRISQAPWLVVAPAGVLFVLLLVARTEPP